MQSTCKAARMHICVQSWKITRACMKLGQRSSSAWCYGKIPGARPEVEHSDIHVTSAHLLDLRVQRGRRRTYMSPARGRRKGSRSTDERGDLANDWMRPSSTNEQRLFWRRETDRSTRFSLQPALEAKGMPHMICSCVKRVPALDQLDADARKRTMLVAGSEPSMRDFWLGVAASLSLFTLAQAHKAVRWNRTLR